MLHLATPQAALAVLALAVLYLVVRHAHRRSIAHLPGPDSDSWLVGNVPSFLRPEVAGEADFRWADEFGLAFRTKSCFGEDDLYLADPKALQHVLNKSGYKYARPSEIRSRVQLSSGRGIIWADGAQHARHRKIMNPAFSSSALRGFLPLFFDFAQKMVNVWKATHHQRKASAVIDVSSWLTRTTLDIIGASGLGCSFNAIDGGGTELYNAYHNLFPGAHYMLSDFTIIFRKVMGFAPFWMIEYLHLLPKKDVQVLTSCKATAHKIGVDLLTQEKKAYRAGKEGGKDIMSIFVKANLSEDPKRQLCDEEVISQIMTLIIAGHETSANTLSWVLFELSTHPDVQRSLRNEIRATRAKVNARGDKQILISDLESMKYNVSVIKETLRFHPIVLQIFREATHDDVIPLERPQRTVSGKMVTAIPVGKGQRVTLSLCVYNRLKSLWGEDAQQWRPERFFDPPSNEIKFSLGVFGNLATFGSGLHSCIGWRFSLLEMQALLIELVENFEFSPPPGDVDIKRGMASIMIPMVKGQEKKGKQLFLTVTPISCLPPDS